MACKYLHPSRSHRLDLHPRVCHHVCRGRAFKALQELSDIQEESASYAYPLFYSALCVRCRAVVSARVAAQARWLLLSCRPVDYPSCE
jgi:hypothetical protein